MKSPITPPAAATLADALGRDPTESEVADVLRASLERVARSAVAEFDASQVADATATLRSRYSDDTWTWRR
jgi:hypothetical protein